jgi:hypothetical protein
MTHARLGAFAKWYCDTCTVNQHPGRLPCTDCCGYTTTMAKVMRDVLNAWGRPVNKVTS